MQKFSRYINYFIVVILWKYLKELKNLWSIRTLKIAESTISRNGSFQPGSWVLSYDLYLIHQRPQIQRILSVSCITRKDPVPTNAWNKVKDGKRCFQSSSGRRWKDEKVKRQIRIRRSDLNYSNADPFLLCWVLVNYLTVPVCDIRRPDYFPKCYSWTLNKPLSDCFMPSWNIRDWNRSSKIGRRGCSDRTYRWENY